MQSNAPTVSAYLKQLPSDRRTLVEAVRAVILNNIELGIQETMNYGMIGYVIPHSLYPAGYHCDPSKPFPYAGLASQKNYCSLYLMPLYNEAENWFRQEWQRGGKKLNMGKCCIRFNKLQDLDLQVIAKALKRFTIAVTLRNYEALRGERLGNKPSGERTAKAAQPSARGKAVKPKAGGSGSPGVKSTSAPPVGSDKPAGAKSAARSKRKSAAATKASSNSTRKKSSPKSQRK